jgi:hypothetical protein
MPAGGGQARLFVPQDLFLGNVICVNGTMFQIVEIDNVSLNFCESYPEEFPMSDIQRVLLIVLNKCVESRLDLRKFLAEADSLRSGRLLRDIIIAKMDSAHLISELNDHELLTLLRRFRAHDVQQQQKWDLYIYPELCDMLSFLYATQLVSGRVHAVGPSAQIAEFMKGLRLKNLEWRRSANT